MYWNKLYLCARINQLTKTTMKKVSLFVFSLLLAGTAAFAQKQTAGNFTAEVNLFSNGLFGTIGDNTTAADDIIGTPINLNQVTGGAKLRYFFADDLAVRLGLNITSASNKFEDTEFGDGTGLLGDGKATSSNIVIAPGIEKHFGTWSKVSPYVGLDLTIGFRSAKEERNQLSEIFATNIENAGFDPNASLTIENANTFNDNGNNFSNFAGTSFGFNLVTGMDFYVTEGLFLGAEMGLGFSTFTGKDITVVASDINNNVNTTTTTVFKGPKSSGFTPNVIGGLRLGWNFGTGSGSPRNR